MSHEQFMQKAVDLALKGYGQTSPNPLVGAVVVKNGKILSEGFHRGAGYPHAEVVAIRNAGNSVRGADLYVTLEPCCHFGRTPPCTELIKNSEIRRVFYGMKDPNPAVNGKGIRKLKSTGISVIGGILKKQCEDLNRPFIKWMRTGFPYVTLKIALTLDGKLADASGRSKWISNELSREYVHMLRAGSDAVMVGHGTYKADKPRLNVRLRGYNGKQPLPMVVRSVRGKKMDMKALLREIGNSGLQSVLVEGGSKLHSELIKRGLVDRFVIFIAPKMFGGKGLHWIGDIGNRSAKRPLSLDIENVFTLGNDIVIEGIPAV